MADLLSGMQKAVAAGASDIFIVPGTPISMKLDGSLTPLEEEKLVLDETARLIRSLYEFAHRPMDPLNDSGDDDFSVIIPDLARFRVNTYRQRGSLAAVLRIINFDIPNWQEMNILPSVMKLANLPNGMILFTGSSGVGKSTTQACLIDKINQDRRCHIVTLDAPLEFIHHNKNSIVSQREVGLDTVDFLSGLRACLRQAPDVIQLGEMRDLETTRTAVTAAETGHLLLATLHTNGAADTINRVIHLYPPNQQDQIRSQLPMVLRAVVCQKLLPDVSGGQIPAFEILRMTPAIRNMIREQKTQQISNAIATGRDEGMQTMDQSIFDLCISGKISLQTALQYAEYPELLRHRLG